MSAGKQGDLDVKYLASNPMANVKTRKLSIATNPSPINTTTKPVLKPLIPESPVAELLRTKSENRVEGVGKKDDDDELLSRKKKDKDCCLM